MGEPNRIVEAVIIGVYLVFLLGIGLTFQKFNSNISDFFRNGCRGTWWLVGSSAFMAGISAYTFTGGPAWPTMPAGVWLIGNAGELD